jgi:G3E family GTPase
LPWDGRRVPITFVGGYLGAGKTTAINEVLAHTDRPIAVIVNDVGSINIDAALIRRRHGDTIELTDGCVCCTSIEGMGAAFDTIRARPTPPDHVIVELSGVAEPQQMLPWGQSAGFMLDGLVVVVAADQLGDNALPTWIQQHLHAQIAAADLLILTKTDLVSVTVASDTRARLAELAPTTPVFPGGRDLVEPGAVGRFLALGGRQPGGPAVVPPSTLFDAHDVRMVAPAHPLTCAELEAWLRDLAGGVEGQLVRAKGIIATTDAGLMLVQIVGSRHELTSVPKPERQAATNLVVISLASRNDSIAIEMSRRSVHSGGSQHQPGGRR